MKRKLLSLVLVAALLASMAIFVPTASASEDVVATVETTDAVGFVGDTVTVDLNLTVDQTTGFQLAFTYDTSRLTYEGITYVAKDLGGNAAGAPQNQQFVNNGPYKMIQASFVDADNATLVLDCSETLAVATLTFTIKDDAPIGDAYVEFCSLNGTYNDAAYRYDKIVRSTELGIADDILYEGSKVTVLPEGYSSESTLPEVRYLTYTDATFAPLDASWSAVVLTKYESNFDGILVIDAVDDNPNDEFPAMPVIIGSQAFNANTKLKAIVLGEQVIEVRAAAFNQCPAADYYVLNPECVIGEGALGAAGTWNATTGWSGRGGATGPYVTLIDGKAVTIHGAAGSTAEAYATATYPVTATYTEASFQYSSNLELPTENTLKFDGNTYYFAAGATAKAPGTAVADGKTVIAWTDGINTYAPGASIVVDKDIALEPVTITAPKTNTTADFKITAEEADLAMRFTSSMSKADYAALAELGDVKLGMLITPAAYVAKAGAFTKEALDALGATNGAYVDIAVNGYYEATETDYIFAGSLKGFSAKTLAKNPDFAAVLYATVTTDADDVFTVYGDFNFAANQDVKTVAEGLSTSSDLTETQKGWLTTLVGKFGA